MSFRNSPRSTGRVRLAVEALESRTLLTVACGPCDPSFPTQPSSVDEGAVVNAAPRTPFGRAVEVGPLVGNIAFEESLGAGDRVDTFALSTEAPTEVRITVAGSESVQLYLVDYTNGTRGSGVSVPNGDSTTKLDGARNYVLFVYDFSSSKVDYELLISAPQPDPPLQSFPEVPYLGRAFDWNLNAVNAPEVWAQGFTGEGTVVAVIDTGVDYLHPDLDENIWVNPGEIAGDGVDNDGNGYVDDVHGWDFVHGDNDPQDGNGHGTHVAGTIAAERNGQGTTGVAYDATILPVKVLNDNGAGSFLAIAQGIRYAVDAGADVINLSLGGGLTRTVQRAIQYAWANDVLVVAAAGNDAAARPGAPAILSSILPNTLSVGAYDRFDNRSVFSNQVGTSRSVQVDAPGSTIASTYINGGYRYLNGTSMAAPHVSGVAALALSANRSVSAVDLRVLLVDSAIQMADGSDSIGKVDAARAAARAFRYDALA